MYGVVDGEVYPVTYGYYYPATNAVYTGQYYYTQSTANNNNTFGSHNGEVTQL